MFWYIFAIKYLQSTSSDFVKLVLASNGDSSSIFLLEEWINTLLLLWPSIKKIELIKNLENLKI